MEPLAKRIENANRSSSLREDQATRTFDRKVAKNSHRTKRHPPQYTVVLDSNEPQHYCTVAFAFSGWAERLAEFVFRTASYLQRNSCLLGFIILLYP